MSRARQHHAHLGVEHGDLVGSSLLGKPFNEVATGNHFAAWQEPELFTTEVRAAFRSLRSAHV
jgi:hypothetical protein